jgi:hypothetical protein
MNTEQVVFIILLVALVSVFGTLAVVYRKDLRRYLSDEPVRAQQITPKAAAPRRVGVPQSPRARASTPQAKQPERPAATASATPLTLRPAKPDDAGSWERKFRTIHSTISEARQREMIRQTMFKHHLNRADAMRKIVEDRWREDAARR